MIVYSDETGPVRLAHCAYFRIGKARRLDSGFAGNFANNLALGYSLALCGYGRYAKSRCASTEIFWLVLSSLSFFIALLWLLRMRMNFWLSLAIALAIMFSCYLLMMALLKKIGVQP